MPLYDFTCDKCGKTEEVFRWPGSLTPPKCCDTPMRRIYTINHFTEKYSPPLWVGRMEDIHKAQEQRGERLRMVHPQEVIK